MIFWSVPLVILFGMLGGQINKLFRPIGIPLSIAAIYAIHHNHEWWCILPTFLYGFLITLGYGPNSKLFEFLQDEELAIDAYSVICCLPIVFTFLLTKNLNAAFGILIVLGAFQIKLGSLGKIGKYDIEINDIFRWSAIGIAMAWALS